MSKPLKSFTTRVPEDLYRRLKVYAVQERTTVQEIIIKAIEEVLAKPKSKK